MQSFTARSTQHPAVFARISVLGDTDPPRRIGVELRFDADERFRWYEEDTGADTEVSSRKFSDVMYFKEAWPPSPWESALEWDFTTGTPDPGPFQA